jgi:hypothetical protein
MFLEMLWAASILLAATFLSSNGKLVNILQAKM